jgi:hypothetical protein
MSEHRLSEIVIERPRRGMIDGEPYQKARRNTLNLASLNPI